MQLLEPSLFETAIEQARISNERIAVLSFHAAPAQSQRFVWRQISAQPAAYAHDLYAALRDLDAAGCQQILVEAPPENASWAAVNDRLRRATTGAGY
jgi:L-threonylcarbamoyladenylate synthase